MTNTSILFSLVREATTEHAQRSAKASQDEWIELWNGSGGKLDVVEFKYAWLACGLEVARPSRSPFLASHRRLLQPADEMQ